MWGINSKWHRKFVWCLELMLKLRIVMMPTLLSLGAPEVVVMTSGAVRNNKVGIMIIPSFQCVCVSHDVIQTCLYFLLITTCPLNTPHIASSYSNEQTTKETKAINNSYIYIYISHVNVTQTVPNDIIIEALQYNVAIIILLYRHII